MDDGSLKWVVARAVATATVKKKVQRGKQQSIVRNEEI